MPEDIYCPESGPISEQKNRHCAGGHFFDFLTIRRGFDPENHAEVQFGFNL